MDLQKIHKKKRELDKIRPLSQDVINNLEGWFRVEFTYASNAIEGNTLTRAETTVVIEKGLTVGGKSLREHLEAINHASALDFIRSLIQKKLSQITEKEILKIHEIILKGLDDRNAGNYRSVPVRISGSNVILPNHRKVPELMSNFVSSIFKYTDPVEQASEAHYQLVTIHPFVDGNGRTARLLMNLILMMNGYPPAIIRKEDRLKYINSLEKAQTGGSKSDYQKLIYKAVERSLDIYLNAVKGKTAKVEKNKLLKIGQVAKATNETVPTIRYWVNQGLIEVTEISASGYQYFNEETIELCKKIRKLQGQRLTLAEIKSKITKL